MKVFVSGGAGVIGRELVQRLLKQGHKLIVGDLQECPPEWVNRLEYIEGDLNHLGMHYEVDVFYHLAATFERLGESPNHWDENFIHNVHLSHHLLNMVKAGRVVFASSYLVSPHPRNLTGAAKLYTECELDFLFKHTRLESCSARIFRSYGCGSRDVISRWVRAAIKKEPISVHNERTAFDFVYAGDVAEALIRMTGSSFPFSMQVGTGNGRRIYEVVEILARHFPDIRVDRQKDQSSLEEYVCDTKEMKRCLRWTPPTTLEEGIAEIVVYEKSRCG